LICNVSNYCILQVRQYLPISISSLPINKISQAQTDKLPSIQIADNSAGQLKTNKDTKLNNGELLQTLKMRLVKGEISKPTSKGIIPRPIGGMYLKHAANVIVNIKENSKLYNSPRATRSHEALEWLYKSILGNAYFDLDRDGFHDDNDLQVSMTSQLGGIDKPSQLPQSNGSNNITNKSAIYSNVIHSVRLLNPFDSDVYAELTSPGIQRNVITLLESPDSTFAQTIGVGSACNIPKILAK
jgi:hypothetical protein